MICRRKNIYILQNRKWVKQGASVGGTVVIPTPYTIFNMMVISDPFSILGYFFQYRSLILRMHQVDGKNPLFNKYTVGVKLKTIVYSIHTKASFKKGTVVKFKIGQNSLKL